MNRRQRVSEEREEAFVDVATDECLGEDEAQARARKYGDEAWHSAEQRVSAISRARERRGALYGSNERGKAKNVRL